jgi:hypothetical protein
MTERQIDKVETTDEFLKKLIGRTITNCEIMMVKYDDNNTGTMGILLELDNGEEYFEISQEPISLARFEKKGEPINSSSGHDKGERCSCL